MRLLLWFRGDESGEPPMPTSKDLALAWTCLIAAGMFEIGWPIGLKWAQTQGKLITGVIVAVVAMAISGVLLYLAQKDIPIGTAYAVWTGIGAAGTFMVGVWFFGDAGSLGRWLGAALIIGGVVTLKLAQ